MTENEPSVPALGACCACGGLANVRNIVLLPAKAPVPGTGWGCVVCGLPQDGAVAVLCDACVAAERKPLFAVKGYAALGQRVPIGELGGSHKHDMSRHRRPRRRHFAESMN